MLPLGHSHTRNLPDNVLKGVNEKLTSVVKQLPDGAFIVGGLASKDEVHAPVTLVKRGAGMEVAVLSAK